MERKGNNIKAFLALVKAGLWNGVNENLNDNHGHWENVDWSEVYRLAEEQSVVGLVAAGIDSLKILETSGTSDQGRAKDLSFRCPQEWALQFIGSTLQIEQRNKEMNDFVAKLIKRLRSSEIDSLVVKGQGVAQCYEKPLWRAAGDVDLLLDEENYEKAKKELFPIAYDIEQEDVYKKHQALKIMGVEVELHGRMPFSVSRKAQMVNDEVVADSLYNGGVCVWKVNETDVFTPNADNHVFLVFTHLLQHFFIEGVGLRQICDWCRMLFCYREELDLELLESRLREAGLMTEWKAFAAMAVSWLGMPEVAMPFYDAKFNAKGSKVLRRVLKSGNFGHNNDLSYRSKYHGLAYKAVATWRRFWDFASLVPVFPVDAPRFFVGYLKNKM